MNRLKGQKAYLAGPIEHAEDSGVTWREEMSFFLKNLNCVPLNPLDKPNNLFKETSEDRIRWKQLRDAGDYDQLIKEGEEIRRVDLRWGVDHCDFVIALYDMNVRSCGTFEEICSANYKKRPVILMCPQGKNKIDMWAFWMFKGDHKMFFSSWEEVKEFLIKVDKGEVDAGKRWIFWS